MAFSAGKSGWYDEAIAKPSPHKNDRPDGEVSLLVIHNISLPAGQFGTPYIDELFCGSLDCHAHDSFADLQGLEVSAHFLIRRSGELVQYVSCDDRAWHAGVSSFAGRSNCNDFAVGIEVEGTDSQAFTPEQYDKLIQLTQAIMRDYPLITAERITGHNDIAPGRKTDPGPCFDWDRYLKGVAAGNKKSVSEGN